MENHKSSLNWIIGAGIVGADIGTSVFYGTGILFPIVGYLAPFVVMTVCVLMWAFKKTYEEGLALSPYNGGAYSMILRTLGRQAAVLAGALTVVSYLATAAVSSLSGAHYLSSMWTGGLSNSTVVLLAFVPIVLFALLNTKGIKEPAKLVTLIAGFHFALLIIISLWGVGFLIWNWSSIDLSGFTEMRTPKGYLSFNLIMYGFAAGFLGITGFESAAQIVEELEGPALETVRKLYKAVIILVSLTAPAISFLCLALLSQDEVMNNTDALLSVLSHKLGGRILLTVIVIDATLTLFAATNTAFVGFIGLATTMAKQGNLPRVMLTRLAHRYPSIQGYPLIAIPFMVVALMMCALVAGEVGILAKVYEIAFLGVMVSFCVGVVLLRNKPLRRNIPNSFLSSWLIVTKKLSIPIVPLVSGLILLFAQLTLMFHSTGEERSMLIQLLAMILLVMAFYRWGVLEDRLETRSDLRLGTGKFTRKTSLPEDLKKYILCTGGTGARRLINSSIRYIHKELGADKAFELVIFHAENGQDPEGFFYELLQRVVSQQIVPAHKDANMILRVKILPGSLTEGLQTLRKTVDFKSVLLGGSAHLYGKKSELEETIEAELEVEVVHI